ncbi:MAG: 16S rRNA (guanine(527)-N(7))-methyltransferase RsmG [Clostridiales bacterium]|jgi:16S rRNA (guanine527-N7)-methyltransferase|nr:16S rRNA (guanine(527)-N(7))-methyltransferase RsmG [Clostridiales bacterium]
MKKLENYLNANSIAYSADDTERFELLYAVLAEKSKLFNLTAITERDDVILKHFIDSVSGVSYIKNNCLDIGAGAGFPSLPLAILKKDVDFLAVDGTQKKVDFLTYAAEKLCLKNYTVIHSRAEDMKDKRESFYTVVARAVAPLNILCEYALPFLQRGGRLVAYKGAKTAEEVDAAQNALTELGGVVIEVADAKIEGFGRKLVIIEKAKQTPQKYPRGGNKPRIKPL